MPYLPWLHQTLVDLVEWPEAQEVAIALHTSHVKATENDVDGSGGVNPTSRKDVALRKCSS
jgi:hypothetical protein